ncbi:MAG: Arc family DNA-binding protein [Ruminococcaceae bacterium]|nr:Arc family DNA-binding protein [Oscillospiraceae bacterium]
MRGVIVATNKIQTGIRFEPEVLYKITYIAKQNVRSLNAQLEFLAKDCIKRYESENGEIVINEEELYK